MGTVFIDPSRPMGSELMYHRYQRADYSVQDKEDNWLRITQQAHDLFCSCCDWQVHFQFALQRKYSSQWHISPAHARGEDVVADTGSSGGPILTGEVDSDMELAAAAAAVEGDTNGLDDSVHGSVTSPRLILHILENALFGE